MKNILKENCPEKLSQKLGEIVCLHKRKNPSWNFFQEIRSPGMGEK